MKSNYIIHDIALNGLKTFPDNSINCVITSPPYWQLRDYGFTEQWGLEPTYQEYLDHLWSLMDEIWRVLKDDGTVWVNLGDTYGSAQSKNNKVYGNNEFNTGRPSRKAINIPKRRAIKEKSLLLIPHRFAIGCMERGWIIRNDIIWAKTNGMPESVTDRFTKKHEYFFFMVKNKNYYFDLDMIRDKVSIESVMRGLRGSRENNKYAESDHKPDGVHANTMNKKRAYKGYSELNVVMLSANGKNPGDVSDFWDIPTSSSNKKHYAVFNNKLIDKPIIAGCPEGGIILDPFCGTGTTLIRAKQLMRNVIGIDGNKNFCKIAENELLEELSQGRFF